MSTATTGTDPAGDRGRQLSRQLGPLVEQAWSRGWEPADLHRLARRDGPVPADLLGDLMAADLARHAAVTVEDRWHAQLEQIGARVWWPPEADPVSARATRASGGWAAVARAAILLQATLVALPPIEQLGALPGTATPRRTPGPEVDQRLLGKVRMMLAKAEATTFPAEAETFTAAAQKLMSRHSIDRTLLDRGRGDRDEPEAIRLALERPYESAKFTLVSAIARANRCRAVWQRSFGFSTVVGFAPDLRAVEVLFTSLLVQATRAMTAEGSRQDWAGRNRTRSFRQSFLTAFAVRIGERLEAAAEAAQDDAVAGEPLAPLDGSTPESESGRSGALDPAAPTARNALVRMLAERDQAVDDALAERFPRLRTQRTRSRLDAEGWVSGTAAADRADLGAPGRLAR